MEDSQEKDQWEVALDKQLEIIKECQQKQHVDSCMKCSEVLNCQVKDNYVITVYESMNKGSGGGFEF